MSSNLSFEFPAIDFSTLLGDFDIADFLMKRRRPEEEEDERFKFHVAGFALGSVNGSMTKFYSGIDYPTDEPNSFILYNTKTSRFTFRITPLPTPNSTPLIPSTPNNFPYNTAPPAANPLRGDIALEDLLTRGLSYFADEKEVQTTKLFKDRRDDVGGRGRGRGRGRAIEYPAGRNRNGSLSPFSVDSSSGSEYATSPPYKLQKLPPTRSLSPEIVSQPRSPRSSHNSPSSSTGSGTPRYMSLQKITLTLSLRRPPRFSSPTHRLNGEEYEVMNGKQVVSWRQGTGRDFVDGVGRERVWGKGEREAGGLGVEGEQEVFKISEYLSYRFVLLLTPNQHNRLGKLLQKLRLTSKPPSAPDNNLPTSTADTRLVLRQTDLVFSGVPGIGSGSNGTKSEYLPVVSTKSLKQQRRNFGVMHPMPGTSRFDILLVERRMKKLDYGIRYLIEGLVSHGIILPSERMTLMDVLEGAIPLKLGSGAEGGSRGKPVEVVESVRERVLGSLFTEERIRNIQVLLPKKAKFLIRHRPAPPRPAHVSKVYRCSVTPTRVVLFPPEDEVNNTILRKYAEWSDRFIRVTFTDEDDRIVINPVVKAVDGVNESAGTLGRVRRALEQGLMIAGRKFVFLAASSSQARMHGCWFVCEDTIDGHTLRASEIMKQMGMIKEKVVAKYAARMGLAFSTTRNIKDSDGQPIEYEVKSMTPDVKRNGYTYTDGAGLCSASVAQAAARALGFRKGIDASPSTIQVRIGGSKGVMTAWPWMTGDQYSLRPSMEKFSSTDTQVNVVRISRFSYAFLNRQFIVLLNDLGVPDGIFAELFVEAARDIHGMAKRYQEQQATAEDLRRATATTYSVKPMIKNGFHKDPCFQDLLKVLECRLLYDLRWRNRIEIKKGVFLLGIPDETGTLREGEVFCRYQDVDDEDATIVTGLCWISRAPALHPGDIRRVQAVDREELRHLRNVILFNTKGERDLPNMLGGGDLDGDDYTLVWDERLMFGNNVEPMNYDAPKPLTVDVVTEQHVKENFVNYLKNDILGQVDNAHLAWAAAPDGGPRSARCLALAEIHSAAVDFAKTGIPAEMSVELRVKQWPDFMGKEEDVSYRCENILGKLFRIIASDPIYKPASDAEIRAGMDNRLVRIPVPAAIMRIAAELKAAYDSLLWAILLRYRISEAEAYSGVILRNGKRRRLKDNDLKEPVNDAFNETVRFAREEGSHKIANLQSSGTFSPQELLAIACYQITYDTRHSGYLEDDVNDDNSDAQSQASLEIVEEDADEISQHRLISFAWLYRSELLALPIITGEVIEIE